ncbi:MAG: alpha/beta hydrolase [Muribaculaceae bacterium]|nr:alpha/beta hydrolase [Muribaculaceae bacterium]
MKFNWKSDILGHGFEQASVDQPADRDGAVRCTVVRKQAATACRRAVLYLHGFSDYFLQKEMADTFVDAGYSFYAVDLRRYGRSLLPGQKMFAVRDLHEYFADIAAGVSAMRADGITEAVLIGHSTGGLTASLYMSESPDPIFKALVLNSPFLAWNLPAAVRRFAIPMVSALARLFPHMRVHQRPDRGYAESLSADYGGEWTYRKEWKPDILPDPDAAWVRAVDRAQKQLRRRTISVPVLLMHSADSVRPGDAKEKYKRADAILDVESIARYGRALGGNVTELTFEGGLHDLVLSRPKVREQVYKAMLDWLGKVLA